jgi:hypothetical protein
VKKGIPGGYLQRMAFDKLRPSGFGFDLAMTAPSSIAQHPLSLSLSKAML